MISVVIPCLNEEETLGSVIQKAWEGLQAAGVEGEIVVADNGSTDRSVEIARELNARVVPVAEKGYGHALMAGIQAAKNEWIIMGDADDSYDFREIPKYYEKALQGMEMVQGCRLPHGGGTVKPGAMPFLHRWFGNPFFSLLVRWWFKAPIHDVYCGLRMFRRDLYERLHQRCTGMEFAVEMIVKASMLHAKIAEVPITLHPDGRRQQRSHLRTFHDGWRTLRFLLLYTPRWLFLMPGLILLGLGMIGYLLAFPGWKVFGIRFDAHTLIVASLGVILGYQSILFGVFTKTFAVSEGLHPPGPFMARLNRHINLERGLVLGAILFLLGFLLLLWAFNHWRSVHFGGLDYGQTMRWVVPGFTLCAVGFQTVWAVFFVSVLRLNRKIS